MSDKMDIWERNCITDPKYTKSVPKGGFNLTAIDAQYQLRMATKEFGAIGEGFGVKHEKFEIHDGIMFYQAVFWWRNIPEDSTFEFGMFSDIAVQANRDIAKKVQTDALTKALSKLGFNADVFLNEFDGNTYTDPVTPKPKQRSKPVQRSEPPTPQPVKDAGVEFEPVTEQVVASGAEIELDERLDDYERQHAIKIINAGREATNEEDYYDTVFAPLEGKKNYVHSEADFLDNIKFSLDKGWNRGRFYNALSIKADEYNGIPF